MIQFTHYHQQYWAKTRGIHERIAESWTVAFTCGNLFSKSNRTWEFIFEEKGLFEISENKNLSKITSYTVLLDLLKKFKILLFKVVLHNIYGQSKISQYISYGEAIEVQCPLQPSPEFVMEPNCTCLLLTPLLLPIIIWLAEMLTLLRKNPLLMLTVFPVKL